MFDVKAGYDGEYISLEYEKIQRAIDHLATLDDDEFLDWVIKKGDKEQMNIVIPNNKFPAWNIAAKIYKNGWKLTEKQRIAIRNVYLYARFGVRIGY